MEKLNELKDALLKELNLADKIIIVPHKNADLDAIGSAIGLTEIATFFNKPSTILLDNKLDDTDSGVKEIINETSNDVNYSQIDEINITENTLFILTDVNGVSRTNLNSKHQGKTIIIDHHNPSPDIIESLYTYINIEVSSASEIITKLMMQLKIKTEKNVANYLLSGIYLDTNKLTKNITSQTMTTVVRLLKCGAEISEINKYFAETFSSDRKVQQIINSTEFYLLNIAIATGSDNAEYTREEIAKAADYLLKFDTDASFSIGNIGNNSVAISGRSNNKIDISQIMSTLGGGGSPQSGATCIENITPKEARKRLIKTLKPFYDTKK